VAIGYPAQIIQGKSGNGKEMRSSLKIAMLSYHTCPLATLGGKDTGGMNVYVRDLTRKLGALGVHVDVFTRSQDEHVPHVLHDLGYGNRVVHIKSGPEVPLPKQALYSFLPEFFTGIDEFTHVKDLEYDLIHSHYWLSGLAAIELKRVWGLPFVHMFHTLGVMKQRVAQPGEEIEGDYRLEGEKRVLEEADRIIAPTPAEIAQLQWLYQSDTTKITIIPPGVDLSRFYPIPADEAKEVIGVPPCDRMLLYVGRIEPLKGIDTLIEALAYMRHDLGFDEFTFCLTVVGGDPDLDSEDMRPEMSRLKDMCRNYGLDDLVTFIGKRDQDTLPYYYSAAEAVVVPSHYESFGMVALEAMACGRPVVASQVGGLAYLVQDSVTGYTVPTSDVQALADRLLKLLKDPDLRDRLGRQAAQVASDFSWDNIANKILNLYREVVL
jgi:D-inositol-3-phosphate glycosyltransferase